MTAPPVGAQPLVDWRRTVRTAVPGLLLLVVIVVLLGVFARDPLLAASASFVDRAGLPGVFLACLVLDSIPGVGAQPILFLAYTGGLGFFPALLVGGTSGVVSGAIGWSAGRGLGRLERVRSWVERSGLGPVLRRHGWRAVFTSAVLPFPYALTTVAAGVADISLGATLLGATGRFPKAFLNLLLVAGGWSVGT